MKYTIRIVTSLEKSGPFVEGVSETIKNEAKEQRTVHQKKNNSLGNLLTGKAVEAKMRTRRSR